MFFHPHELNSVSATGSLYSAFATAPGNKIHLASISTLWIWVLHIELSQICRNACTGYMRYVNVRPLFDLPNISHLRPGVSARLQHSLVQGPIKTHVTNPSRPLRNSNSLLCAMKCISWLNLNFISLQSTLEKYTHVLMQLICSRYKNQGTLTSK